MTSTYARKRDGRQYRYYVSQAVLKGKHRSNIQVARLAAAPIEELIQRTIEHRFKQEDQANGCWKDTLVRAVVAADGITMEVRTPDENSHDSRNEQIHLKISFRKRGSENYILAKGASPNDTPPQLNRPLVRALVRARSWRRKLESGEAASIEAIARAEQVNSYYVSKLLPLSFLAPDLTEAIITGNHPPLLMLQHVRETTLALEWSKQRDFFGRFVD